MTTVAVAVDVVVDITVRCAQCEKSLTTTWNERTQTITVEPCTCLVDDLDIECPRCAQTKAVAA